MENKDEEIHGMDIMVDAIQMSVNIPECMSTQQIQQVTAQDEHLQWLKDDMAVIDGIIMKGRCVIIPEILKTQALDQLHINHM